MICKEKCLKVFLTFGGSVIIPAFLSWVILFFNKETSDWIGFVFLVFFFAFMAMLCSVKKAYDFVVKEPRAAKFLLFSAGYYLLWCGFFFFGLLMMVRWVL